MDVAADVLAEIDPKLDVPISVRDGGVQPWRRETTPDELGAQVAAAVASEAAEIGEGHLAVLVPESRLTEIRRAVGDGARGGVRPDGPAPGPGGPGDGSSAESTGRSGRRPSGSDPSGSDPSGSDPGGSDPGGAAGPDIDRPVVVLTVSQAKGLEFDSVLVADPAQILAESPRGYSDLYVALTRATQRLGVLHPGPVPDVLQRLAPLPG